MFKSEMSSRMKSGGSWKVVLVSECIIFYILGGVIKRIFPKLRDKVFFNSGKKTRKWT